MERGTNYDQTPAASVVVLTDYEATRIVELLGDRIMDGCSIDTARMCRKVQAKITAGRKLLKT